MVWRQERDPWGRVLVPAEAYWGAQTQRALENFPGRGGRIHPILIDALVLIKIAAAQAYLELQNLQPQALRTVMQAAREILAGLWREHFPLDVFQAGDGAGLDGNVNEVLANRGEELLGGSRGEYRLLHPQDQAILGPATPRIFFMALRLAILMELRTLYSEGEALVQSMGLMKEDSAAGRPGHPACNPSFPEKPPLSNLFQAAAAVLASDLNRIRQGGEELLVMDPGSDPGAGTDFSDLVIGNLTRLTGLELRRMCHPPGAGPDLNPCGQTAAHLKLLALTLTRFAHDLRLLTEASPMAPGTLQQPEAPATCEALRMICCHVIGLETAAALGLQAAQVGLNPMAPLVTHEILTMIDLLRQGLAMFTRRAVRPLRVGSNPPPVISAGNPSSGYSRSSPSGQFPKVSSRRKNSLDRSNEQGYFFPAVQVQDPLEEF